jgi:NADH-quinone oxidoreductase subunit L
MLFGGYFGNAIVVRPEHAAMAQLQEEWHGTAAFVSHAVLSLPFWLALAGIAAAAYLYLVNPALPERLRRSAGALYTLLDNKYYFDRFNDWFFAGGARVLGRFASAVGDRTIIDGWLVNGSARLVALVSREFRRIQSGYVYHYAFVMIIGVFGLLYWWGVR